MLAVKAFLITMLISWLWFEARKAVQIWIALQKFRLLKEIIVGMLEDLEW